MVDDANLPRRAYARAGRIAASLTSASTSARSSPAASTYGIQGCGLSVKALVVILAALSLVPASLAADTPTPKLDEIASVVAGKAVTVHCEIDDAEWNARIVEVSKGLLQGYEVDGYAFPNTTRLFLAPQACRPLLAALEVRVNFTTAYEFSVGLVTLIHEATHLRGLLGEGEADCEAVREAPSYIDDFGIPAKTTLRRVVRGIVVYTRIANPLIARLKANFKRVHDLRPPAYQGTC